MHVLLKQFKKREGHCNVPQSHKEDGANLGLWVSHQRQLKKLGKLDPDRLKILKGIGFEWALVEGRTSMSWEDILSHFKKREGHCNVPQSHKEDGAKVGVWVSQQRPLKKTWTLDPDRLTRLEEVGEWGGKV
jgi:hypothetical protein